MIILLNYFALRRNLIEVWNYKPRTADRTLFRLFLADRRVKRQLAAFYKGDTPDLCVAGISYAELTDPSRFAMNPYAALLFLDWLIRDPREALRSLTMPLCGFRPQLSPDEVAPELRDEVLRRSDAASKTVPALPEEEPVEIPRR